MYCYFPLAWWETTTKKSLNLINVFIYFSSVQCEGEYKYNTNPKYLYDSNNTIGVH